MMRFIQAGRRRLERVRRGESSESGFIMVYVLLVSMMITLAVTSMLAITANNISPALASQNNDSATEAAEAGIQDAIAWLNNNSKSSCATAVDQSCPAALGHATASATTLPNGAKFTWAFMSSYVHDTSGSQYLRVTSTGTSSSSSKTLIADIQGVQGVFDYGYYSTYETAAQEALDAYYASRNIDLANSAEYGAVNTSNAATSSALSLGSPTVVHWNGTKVSSPSDSVCDDLWYDSALNKTGSSRSATQAGQSLPAGADWAEGGNAGATSLTRYAPCQVAFSSGMTFDGKVYTVDAPLISDQILGGAGPNFKQAVNTAWSQANVPAATASNFAYRSDPYSGGYLTTAGSFVPTTQSNVLTFSPGFNPTPQGTACVFYGPTRVLLNGDGTATVTSPQSSPLTPATGQVYSTDTNCYANKNSNGQYTVSYTTAGGGVIYVKNQPTYTTTGSSPTATTTKQTATTAASNSNTVFNLSAGTSGSNTITVPVDSAADTSYAPSVGDNPSTKSDGAWVPKWTSYSSGSTCTTGTSALDLKFFNCYQGGSSAYTTLRTTVEHALATTPSSYTTAAALQTYLNGVLAAGNSADAANSTPTNSNNTSHRWSASVVANPSASATCTPGTAGGTPSSTTINAPMKSDSLFGNLGTNTDGSTVVSAPVTTTCFTGTVTAQIGQSVILGLAKSWGDGGLLGLGLAPGSTIPQFNITFKVVSTATTTTVTAATSTFPSMKDVTQYEIGTGGANGSNGPGDAYLEGTNTAPLSVLSDNDTIVTGNIQTTNSSPMDIDSLGNVRIYNPVKCTDQTAADINATSAGFCPNDITGLYTGGLTSSTGLLTAHPANQYTNLVSSASALNRIDAAVVAQGGAASSGGSVLSENFDRGSGLGTLQINGGIYQLHRGALGEQWELQSSNTTRFTSGYALSLKYVSQLSSPYVPVFSGGSVTRYWNLVSISSTATS